MSKRSRIAKVASFLLSSAVFVSFAGSSPSFADDAFADHATDSPTIGNSLNKDGLSKASLLADSLTSTPGSAVSKSKSAAKQDGTVGMHILDIADPVLIAGKDLRVTAVVTNTTQNDATITGIELNAQTRNSSQSAQIYGWLNGESSKTKAVASTSDATVPAGSERRLSFNVPAANLPWSSQDTWGVHGIEVHAVATLNNREVNISDRSLVVTSNGRLASPMPVNVVVPVTASLKALAQTPNLYDELTLQPGDASADKTDQGINNAPGKEAKDQPNSGSGTNLNSELNDVDRDQSPLVQTIQKYDADGVHMLVDPSALESPQIRTALATKQHATADLLPMFDADYAALAHVQQYEIARKIVAASINAGQNAINQPRIGFAYLEGNVDQNILNLIQVSGVPGAIVPSDALSQRKNSYYTPSPHTKLPTLESELDVLVTDSAINAAISGKLISADDEKTLDLDPVDSRQAALALTAIHTFQAPNFPRPILISVPRNAVESAQTLANVQAVLKSPWLTPVPFSALQHSDLNKVRYRALAENLPNSGEFSKQDLSHLDEFKDQLEQLSSVLIDKKPFNDLVDKHSTRLFAVNFRSNPALRSQYLAAMSENSGIFQEIHFQPLSTINMISESAAIPARITNPFSSPIQVTVHLKAPDSRIFAPQPVKVVIPAKSTTNVSVPVEARGSGNLKVALSITNDAGTSVGMPLEVNMRVRATWESTGTLIMAALVASVLVFGLVKAIRKGRRSAPVDPEEFTSKLEAVEHAEEESLKAVDDLPKLG
ncbi:hypothetical protein JOD55_000286 [Arcanobacterium pluranimalium]|uniref:DUF6049 family protein n=1 Tax=Arcanobacterium pluranimalium TaxID=108028 RepID=UPI00195E0BED|nr:hypothetical protein [Arcanobacterium pluranimalium]